METFGESYILTLQIVTGAALAFVTLLALGVVFLFCANVVRRMSYFQPGERNRWRNIVRYAWSDIWL